MNTRIESAFAQYRERAEDIAANAEGLKERLADLRREAPTLTTALVLAVLLVGFTGGWFASQPFTRWAVNAEWRERIAKRSNSVRQIIGRGDTDADALDALVIKSLEDTDAKLTDAERRLRDALKALPSDRCSVPADCLRQQ